MNLENLDRQYCYEQSLRFSGLPGYPKTDDGRRSLIDAMHGAFAFGGPSVVRRWVDDCLRCCDRCPLPRDAYRAGAVGAPEKKTVAHRCTVCYDTGQSTAEFLVTWRDGKRFRQRLSTEQAATLWTKHRECEKRGDASGMLAVGKQMIYEGAVACECRPPERRMPEPPEERQRSV